MPVRLSGQTNQRTVILVAVVLVLVAVIVVGLAWNFSGPRSTESETSNQTGPTTVLTTTSTPADTSTWLLYGNTKYGYEIKYPPSGYSGILDVPGGPTANSPSAGEADFYLSTSSVDNGILIDVMTAPRSACYSVADSAEKISCYRSSYDPGFSLVGTKEVDLAGARVLQLDYCRPDFEKDCDQKTGFKNRFMTVEHAGLYYNFVINFSGAEPAKDISKILNTFRFTK
jgi:hypothetical protein